MTEPTAPPAPEPSAPTTPDHDRRGVVARDVLGDPRPALREFGLVAAVFALLWVIPYAHPVMEDYRYLDLIDFSPLARAVTFTKPPAGGAAAIPGGVPPGDVAENIDEAAALAALDPSLKQPVAPSPGAVAKAPTPPKAKAPTSPGAPPSAPTTAPVKPARAPLPGALQITDETIGKLSATLEHPERMDAFFAALVARAKGERELVRVRHYGDSHLANDGLSLVLRVLLQRRFGDGGHGYMLAASRTKWYRRKGVRWAPNAVWKARNYLGGSQRDGAYGYGGGAAIGTAGAQVRVRTSKKGPGQKANRLELFWRGIAPAAMQVRIDGKTEVVKVKGDKKDTFRSWELKDGAHDVRVRVTRGRVKLLGIALERDSGLIYDSLGIVGARARRWLNANADHMALQLKHRPTQLVVFNYGGNSLGDRISKERYIDRYAKVVERLRPNKAEACLIIGPTDHGKKKRGRVISDPKSARMIGWQRTLADKVGCAFLDSRGLMGGAGSMGRWVKQGLGWADYSHLTPKGQRALGKAMYGAWMHGLRAYLKRTAGE